MKFITEFLNSGTAKQQKRKRLGALLICITAALLAVALIVLAVFGIAGAIKNRGAEEEETEETGDQIPKGYVTHEFSKDQAYSGLLLSFDTNREYSGKDACVAVTGRERPLADDGKPVYSVKFDFVDNNITEEVFTKFNAMMTDFYADQKDGWLYLSKAQYGSFLTLEYVYKDANQGTQFASIYDAEAGAPLAKYQWIYDHAAEYGFVLASTKEGEENIFRYVGEAHSNYMADKDMSFAEYIAMLHEKTGAGKTHKYKVAGVTYETYYIGPMDTHVIPDPEKYTYTVNGDNEGGYFVTFTKIVKADKN